MYWLEDRTYLIAEVGLAHEGSMLVAHSYIDAVADIGADAIKFQIRMAEHESSLEETFRVPISSQYQTRFDYWKKTSFSFGQWSELKSHCDDRQLDFLATPFSKKALEYVDQLDCPFIKIGSAESLSLEFLELAIEKRRPLVVSTGMSSGSEIQELVDFLIASGEKNCVMHCVSKYPAPLEESFVGNVGWLRELGSRYVGLSDHSGSIFPCLYAMAHSVDIVEAHVIFDRRQYGVDASASITIDELGVLVAAAESFNKLGRRYEERTLDDALLSNRRLFERSLCTNTDLNPGDLLSSSHLYMGRPGIGLRYDEAFKVLGKRVKKKIRAFSILSESDVIND